MQAMALMGIYVLTAAIVQFLGFLVSRVVDYQWPTASVLVFLILFLAAYGIAWPIAVWITEWLIVKLGYEVEKADPRAT
jgi:hypothetical protein